MTVTSPNPLRRLLSALATALPMALTAAAGPAQAALMISQVYGGGGNSGAPLQNDFVELHNNGAAAVDLSSHSVQYTSSTGTSWANQKVALTGSIPAGGYYLVRLGSGGSNGAALPAADATGSFNMSATAGKVALVSSTASLPVATCPTAEPTVVDFVGFGAAANCSETRNAPAPSATLAIVRASTGNGCVDSNDNGADFATAAPLPRHAATPAQPCGGGGGGGGGEPAVALKIFEIQGSGATSAHAGKAVVTTGVVTRVNNDGFFIQDLAGDGNPATSDGILVYTGATVWPAAVVGHLVEVTATVVEFKVGSGAETAARPLTELGSVAGVVLQGNGYSIAPTVVTLPLAAGDSLERFEGMLVTLRGPLTVQQNTFQARYGQLTLGAGGRHETPTNRHRPSTLPGAPVNQLADLQVRSRVLLDDGTSQQNVDPTPWAFAGGVPRAGDSAGDVTGVVDFGLATASSAGAGLYRIHPTAPTAFTATNPRQSAPAAVGGNVRVAGINVLNFFTTFTNGQTADGRSGQGCSVGGQVSAGHCRGADNAAEFGRQRDKIVRAIAGLDADVVGLMEIQNNGNGAVDNLVAAINAHLGSTAYAAVAVPAGSGATGTDAIRVAMIYKPSRLATSGAPASDTAAINNRPPLAQTFVAANGEQFTLVVNHLKSKGGCPAAGDPDADQGDGQACWNATRLQQAQRLRTFVAQVQSASGVDAVLLVGDFNAYAQEDPIVELTGNGYVDVVARHDRSGYSYVFDGTAGRLDHAIATAAMAAKVAGVTEWHINADEQTANDYNLEFKQPACATCAPDPYAATPYRASDHDPVLVGVDLYKVVNGTSGDDVLVGSDGDDIVVGGPGADTLTLGGGADIVGYTGVADGGDTIVDFQPGVDRIDLRALLTGLGVSSSRPIRSGHVSCSATGGDAVIRVGNGSSAPRPMATLKNVSCATALADANFIFPARAVAPPPRPAAR